MSQAQQVTIKTPKAPAAIGPYVQAVRVDKTVYISGQLGLDPATMEFAGPTVEEQAEMAIQNLLNIVKEAGGSGSNIVKTTILLANIDDFAKVNEIYAKHFSEPYPARACFAVKSLPKSALVEIEAIAVINN